MDVDTLQIWKPLLEMNLTLLDLLTKNARKVAVHLGLEDVANQIDKINFEEKFPCYASMLKIRVSKKRYVKFIN